MPPLVSLIMLYHDRPEYLGEAVASVLQQSYPNWELILWGNEPSKTTDKLCKFFSDSDPRIHHFPNTKKEKIILSLKKAFKISLGDYLGLVDSDDLLCINTLEETVADLEDIQEAAMVYTNHLKINTESVVTSLGKSPEYSYDLLLKDFITFHFRLIRRSVIEELNLFSTLDPNNSYAYDYEMSLMIGANHKIIHNPKYLYNYRIQPNSITRNNSLAQHQICKNLQQKFKKLWNEVK